MYKSSFSNIVTAENPAFRLIFIEFKGLIFIYQVSKLVLVGKMGL